MQPGGAIRNLLTCQIQQGRSADPFLLANGFFEKFHGIEFDRYGRAKNYYFLIGEHSNTTKVPASAVLHIFDAERISQSRAYPQIQHSINDVIDRKEILALEKKKVKSISDIVHILKGRIISADFGSWAISASLVAPSIINALLQPVKIPL